MRGPRHLELGAELVAHQLVRGIVAERHAEGVADPLAHLIVGGKPLRLLQGLLELGDLGRRQGRSFARRNIACKQGVQAALGVTHKSAPNGVAVNATYGGNLATETRLTTGQQIEHVEALMLDGMALMGEQLFKRIGGFMDDGNGFIHQVPTTYQSIDSDDHYDTGIMQRLQGEMVLHLTQ